MAIIRIGSQKEYLQHGGGAQAARAIAPVNAGVVAPAEGLGSQLLRAGAEGLGRLMRPVAEGYREAQTERVDDALLNVEREFAAFRDEWTESHKGRDGLEADAVFAKRHAELAEAAIRDLDPEEDEIFRGLLEKRLAQQNLHVLKEGQAYRRQQKEAYQQSQWEGQLASFARLAEENPQDIEGLRQEADNLLLSWQAKNPGKDATAVRLKLEDLCFTRRMDTLLAEASADPGKIGAARAALNMSLSERGSSPGDFRGRGKTEGRGHSIAEDLCNPLNLKKVGHGGGQRGDYENFASDQDGFMAAWRQLKIYQNGKRKLETPRRMIETWAPASDGNNLEKYFATVKKFGGVDIDRKIDINNPAEAAALIRGMACMESPLGSRYSVAEVAEMLRSGKGIARAEGSGGGVSPMKSARYALQLEQLERRQLAEQARKMQQPLDDYFAKCKAGVVVEPPFAEHEIIAAYGENAKPLLEQIEREGAYAVDLAQTRLMTQEEQDARLEARKPDAGDDHYAERLDTYNRLAKAVEQNRKARAEDPAGYVTDLQPDIMAAAVSFMQNPDAGTFQTYLNRMNWECQNLGLKPVESGNIFPRQLAGDIADNLQESDNAGEFLRAVQKATGEHYPAIVKQLAPKLGLNALIYASGMPDKAVARIMEARRDPKFRENAEAQLGLTGPDKTGFDEDLAELTKDITSTFASAGNTQMPQAIRENIKILAYQYALTMGLDLDEALSRAANEVILDRYELGKSAGGALYRIPREPGLDRDEIEKGITRYVRRLNMDEVSLQVAPNVPEKYQRNAYRRMLQHNAQAVTAEDESGIYLFNNGQPLRARDGEPILITWAELLAKEEKAE